MHNQRTLTPIEFDLRALKYLKSYGFNSFENALKVPSFFKEFISNEEFYNYLTRSSKNVEYIDVKPQTSKLENDFYKFAGKILNLKVPYRDISVQKDFYFGGVGTNNIDLMFEGLKHTINNYKNSDFSTIFIPKLTPISDIGLILRNIQDEAKIEFNFHQSSYLKDSLSKDDSKNKLIVFPATRPLTAMVHIFPVFAIYDSSNNTVKSLFYMDSTLGEKLDAKKADIEYSLTGSEHIKQNKTLKNIPIDGFALNFQSQRNDFNCSIYTCIGIPAVVEYLSNHNNFESVSSFEKKLNDKDIKGITNKYKEHISLKETHSLDKASKEIQDYVLDIRWEIGNHVLSNCFDRVLKEKSKQI
jgi:hypothetical protein